MVVLVNRSLALRTVEERGRRSASASPSTASTSWRSSAWSATSANSVRARMHPYSSIARWHRIHLPATFWCAPRRTRELLIAAVRRAVLEANPESAVAKIKTLDEASRFPTASPRTTAQLFGLFAGLALVIAVAGIGSMLALWVRQRMREIGIRIALGAARRIFSTVLRQGMVLVAVGLACGFGRRAGAHQAAEEAALRSDADRCAHLCRGVGAAPRGRTAGLLGSGAPCRAHRSASGAALRISLSIGEIVI